MRKDVYQSEWLGDTKDTTGPGGQTLESRETDADGTEIAHCNINYK